MKTDSDIRDEKFEMKSKDVVELYNTLTNEDVTIWIDGGWGVDALLEKQTRSHQDLDIVIQEKDLIKFNNIMDARGYKNVPRDDTRAWNYILGDNNGHLVDVHVIVLDDVGNGIYGPKENGVMYPASALTCEGLIDGIHVRCISAEYSVKSHTGYLLKEKDYHDVKILCDTFGIEYPREHSHIKD